MTNASPAKRMRAIALAAAEPVLGPLGFRRSDLRWSRAAGDGIEWNVEVEKEKHTHGKDRIGFAIAWGVCVSGFYEVLGEELPRHTWGCTLHGRVTDLARGGTEWWIVTDEGTTWFGLRKRPSDEEMAADIGRRLERDLLPFLAPLTTPEAVADLIEERADFLVQRGIWPDDPFRQLDHVAVLRLLDGDTEAALAAVETMRQRADARGIRDRVEKRARLVEERARGSAS